MPTARFAYEGGLRVTGVHEQSGAQLSTDAPTDNHGRGEAFSPTDLVAAALVTCMMTIAGIEIEKGRLPRIALSADVQKTMASTPRRIQALEVNIHVTGTLSEQERLLLERAVKSCPVAHSLHPELLQRVQFHYHHS